MSRTRLVSVVALTALAATGYAAWAERMGLDFWNVSALDRKLGDAVEEGNRLDGLLTRARHAVALKDRAVADLAARRITFAEACVRFREADVERPEARVEQIRFARQTEPGLTEEEWQRRTVMRWLLARLEQGGPG